MSIRQLSVNRQQIDLLKLVIYSRRVLYNMGHTCTYQISMSIQEPLSIMLSCTQTDNHTAFIPILSHIRIRPYINKEHVKMAMDLLLPPPSMMHLPPSQVPPHSKSSTRNICTNGSHPPPARVHLPITPPPIIHSPPFLGAQIEQIEQKI